MATQTKKPVQANYSEALIAVLVSEYQALIVAQKGDNSSVLKILSEKHGKTVSSLRAKLASLKVYKSALTADNNAPVSGDKATKKEDIANSISSIVGVELVGLEVATKATLQTLLTFLLKTNKLLQEREDKINSLISEMLAEDEPVIVDDINDND